MYTVFYFMIMMWDPGFKQDRKGYGSIVVCLCVKLCQGVEHFCKACYCAFLFFSENCLFSLFTHLLTGIFVLCSYNFHSPSYSLDFNPMSEVKIFNQFLNDLCAVWEISIYLLSFAGGYTILPALLDLLSFIQCMPFTPLPNIWWS